MNFSKLAVTEIKRNPTRTRIAVLASALAAMLIILLRIIPEGYPLEIAMPERTYSGGDIVIFPALAPISSAEDKALILRDWQGSDWQSHILYYFPKIKKTGYFCSEGAIGWRAMIPKDVISAISDIPNIKNVYPYRALPCLVTTETSGTFPAILRGFNEQPPHSLEPYLHKEEKHNPSRFFSESCVEDMEAITSRQVMGKIPPGSTIHVAIPEPRVAEFVSPNGDTTLHMGMDWDNLAKYSFLVVGEYSIKVHEVIDYEASLGSPDPHPKTIPLYWERPEILIPSALFEKIAEETSDNIDPAYFEPFSSVFPTYQITLTVDNMSQIHQTTHLIREALGDDYGVYAIPEALFDTSSKGHVVMPPDLHKLFSGLIMLFSALVVAGNIYIIVVQQKRKIGLFRVVGATSKDIRQYVLTMVAYVSLSGTCIGALLGNLLYFFSFLASDMAFGTWLSQVLSEFAIITGISLLISLSIGFSIAHWASKLPCAEVLSHE